MLDPLAHWILALCFSMLFVMAGLHKTANKVQFRVNLTAYRLLPARAIPLLATTIPLFEIFLGLAWLSSLFANIVALLSASLLAIYTTAIGINLIRGRSYIDCGCGLSSSKGNSGDIQQLSSALLIRNGLLISAALLASLPSTDRLLGLMDFFAIATASIVFILLYLAFNQVLANNGAIRSWRHSHG